MPEVTIEVAGRRYRVGCGEGEETHLMRLAHRIDVEATSLSGKMGQMPESRLMLMSALMLADKLTDAEASCADAETRALAAEAKAKEQAVPQLMTPERDAEIARNLDALASRIEALAGRMNSAA